MAYTAPPPIHCCRPIIRSQSLPRELVRSAYFGEIGPGNEFELHLDAALGVKSFDIRRERLPGPKRPGTRYVLYLRSSRCKPSHSYCGCRNSDTHAFMASPHNPPAAHVFVLAFWAAGLWQPASRKRVASCGTVEFSNSTTKLCQAPCARRGRFDKGHDDGSGKIHYHPEEQRTYTAIGKHAHCARSWSDMRPSNFVFALLRSPCYSAACCSASLRCKLGISRFAGQPQPDPPAIGRHTAKAEPVFDKPTETTIYKTEQGPSRLSMDGDRQPSRPWLIGRSRRPWLTQTVYRKLGRGSYILWACSPLSSSSVSGS